MAQVIENLRNRSHKEKRVFHGVVMYNPWYLWADINAALDAISDVIDNGVGGGLTPEQEAKLDAIIIDGDGTKYLSNDGTYKNVDGIDFRAFPDKASFPSLGEENHLYLDNSNGNLYYWDGSDYHIVDQGIFNNYLPLTGGAITGTTTYLGSELVTIANAVVFDSSNNITLRNGTKITGASSVDATNHELFGLNSYNDSFGDFDQLEVGSQEALFNVNIVYDTDRTLGHATADVYNPDGSYKGKEVFAYVSDVQNALIPHSKVTNQNLSAIGATGSLTYDGITGTVQNTDGTFLSMSFTSDTEYASVNIVRTVYATSANATQRLDNVALGTTPVTLTPLTIGANVRVEIELIINDTGDIYTIIAGGPTDLTTCWGYVEKI